jgi:hypothetical protein
MSSDRKMTTSVPMRRWFLRDKNVMGGRSGFRLRADWEIEVVESGACRRKPSVAADEFLK